MSENDVKWQKEKLSVTDRQTDQQTDRQDGSLSCMHATDNVIGLIWMKWRKCPKLTNKQQQQQQQTNSLFPRRHV